MDREICIRVDGGAKIGLGHVVRCLSLAYMLRDYFKINFFVRELPAVMVEKILEEGFRVVFIREEKDLLGTLQGTEIVVLDHYGLDSDFQKVIKRKGNFLVCIDDIPNKKFYADLIINHAPGIVPEEYKAEAHTQFALGLDYALLRPQFLKIAGEGILNKKVDNLLICFGGSDPHNLTEKVLEVSITEDRFIKITVVLGPAFSKVNHIHSIAENDNRVEVLHSLDENQMVEVMKRARVAVVPASGILMEALAAQCIVISGMYVKNQSYVYNHFKNSNFFLDAKGFEKQEIKAAFSEIDRFRLPEKLFDGKSGSRIRRLFRSLPVEKVVQIREAVIDDLQLTYSWAANAELRQHSFTKKEISYSEHVEWFSNKVRDPNCIYFIAEENGKAMGSLRYDISGGTAIISYLVDPSFQGRGMGMILLKKAFSLLRQYPVHVDLVVGYVMLENIASQKSFQRLGYLEEYQETEKKYKYSKKII